jgi:hypothetical protein
MRQLDCGFESLLKRRVGYCKMLLTAPESTTTQSRAMLVEMMA